MADSIIKQVKGFNHPRRISDTEDLNTFYTAATAGIYYAGATAGNNPANAWGCCLCFANAGTGAVQLFINSSGMWFRAYAGIPAAWSSWQKVALT